MPLSAICILGLGAERDDTGVMLLFPVVDILIWGVKRDGVWGVSVVCVTQGLDGMVGGCWVEAECVGLGE